MEIQMMSVNVDHIDALTRAADISSANIIFITDPFMVEQMGYGLQYLAGFSLSTCL